MQRVPHLIRHTGFWIIPKHTVTMTKGSCNRFLLLFGSQTGQAKAIAEEMAETAETHGLHADLHCLSETEKKFWLERESCVVIVTSTTGDGEPPETALKFWRRLRKKTLPSDHLKHLHYALLGLGDSNYSNFCNCGKTFDHRLQQLGAKQFYDCGWADDAVGLEVIADPWLEGVWPALKAQLSKQSDNGLSSTSPAAKNCTAKDTRVDELIEQSDPLAAEQTESILSENVNKDCQTGTNILCNGNSAEVVNKTMKSGSYETDSGKDIVNISSSVKSLADGTLQLGKETQTLEDNNSCHLEDDKENKTETKLEGPKENQTKVKVEGPKEIVQDTGSSKVTCDTGSEVKTASVRHSVPPLCESGLTMPKLADSYLQVHFHPEQSVDIDKLPIQNGCIFPSASSDVVQVPVMLATRLTRHDSVKTALDIELDISSSPLEYQPGDAFGVVCPNPAKEVQMLIKRLGLEDQADCVLSVSVIEGTKKRNASVASHYPLPTTLTHLLTTCCDIRAPAKKAFLRALVECTEEAGEKRRLQELCSKQGSSDYTQFIREPSLSLLDILMVFPSCQPKLATLLEHLPRLQARPYSASSSALHSPGRLHFVFNIVEIPNGDGRWESRRGVCTGWLDSLTAHIQSPGLQSDPENVVGQVSRLQLEEKPQISIFGRTNQHFHLPDDPTIPVVMIGPGTGVAPFVGFLRHREAQRKSDNSKKFGETWLLFGCRHKERDFLYREELEGLVSTGTLSRLLVSFSRDQQDGNQPRYVQDNLLKHGAAILDLLSEQQGQVYVCGDAHNMAKNVAQTFVQLLHQHRGMTAKEAEGFLMQMRLHKKYHEDVWT